MSNGVTIGIDPGMTGAIALYGGGRLLHVCDMPVVAGDVDPYQLAAIFARLCAPEATDLVIIEKQQAYPGQGASSNFKTGNGYGVTRGVAAALGYRISPVAAATWKRRLELPKPPPNLSPSRKVSAKKGASRMRASQLMPEGATIWRRKKDDGRAEAALLAYYGACYELASVQMPLTTQPGGLFSDPPLPDEAEAA